MTITEFVTAITDFVTTYESFIYGGLVIGFAAWTLKKLVKAGR